MTNFIIREIILNLTTQVSALNKGVQLRKWESHQKHYSAGSEDTNGHAVKVTQQ